MDLSKPLEKGEPFPEEELKELIRSTRDFSRIMAEKLASGRDRLLELNSYRPKKAEALMEKIRAMDGDERTDILMSKIFKFYSISPEPIMERTYRLEVFNAEEVDFPGIKGDRMVVTFDRKIAVTRDDIEFLTWDHPMVTGAIELFLGSGKGNASIVEMKGTGKPGIFLESVYILECVAPGELHMNRFLARRPIRTLVDHNLQDLTAQYPWEIIRDSVTTCGRSWLGDFPGIKERLVPDLLGAGFKFSEKEAAAAIDRAKARVVQVVGGEAGRLTRLRKINPAIRGDEILALRNESDKLLCHMERARLRLDSLRLIKVS